MGVGGRLGVPWGTHPCGAIPDLQTVLCLAEWTQTHGRHGMSERYLEQMLAALRKGGYLVSACGPRGGHPLTSSPERITVAEVKDCLEGGVRAERQPICCWSGTACCNPRPCFASEI